MEDAQKIQEQELQLKPENVLQSEEAEKLLVQEKKLKAQIEQKVPEFFKPDQQDSNDASIINKTNSGHMLDRFELIPNEKTPFLTFKGFFDPRQFPHIKISPTNSKTETSVLLPNTLINSILMPEREVTSFSDEGILEKMLLEEKITKKENGEIAFQVTDFLAFEGAFEKFHVFRDGRVAEAQLFDLPHRVHDGCMITSPELATDFRQRARGQLLA